MLRLTMERTQQQLILNRGDEKFVFRYEQGDEDQLLDALIDQARNKSTSFDWFDAAVLSFKLTQSLIGQAEEIISDKKNAPLA